MSHRCLVAVSGLVLVVAVGVWCTIPVAGQTGSAGAKTTAAAAKAYTAPRTPEGQPDLQGFWSNTTFTPLERPKDVTKEFYTREEALEIVKRASAQEAELTEPGTVADVHYDFTQFGLDKSQSAMAFSLRTSLIVDPPDGRLPPLSAEGQRRAAERAAGRKARGGTHDAVQNEPLGARCILMDRNGPPMLGGAYNNTYQIMQTRDYVMILVEMLHDVRIVPLDGRPQLAANVRQWTGSSRGRWEGQTLVIETTNLSDKFAFLGSSENMRLTERFTRVAEDTLRYQFTVEDPATWTRAWSAEVPWKKDSGPIFEHACHEGNYGLYNTLVGARAEEKRAAEEAAKKKSPK
jgi:hypothetical protein